MKYWTGAPFYGFGCSAHSFDGTGARWSNERDTKAYAELVEAGKSPIAETTELDARALGGEAIFLGLRLLERGVDLAKHRARFGADVRAQYRDDLQRFTEAGLIEMSGDTIRLTPHGALLSNEVFSVFV
jgi:oxygen-independent coproporphyrinogen-3 oxidase